MVTSSLKTKLTFTLASLLTIGMLLILIVFVMLRQHQSLQSEVAKGRLFLELAADNLDHEAHPGRRFDFSDRTQQLLEDGSVSCLRLKSGERIHALLTSRKENAPLDTLLANVTDSGHGLHIFSGTDLGIITFGSHELLMAVPVYNGTKVIGAIGFSQDLAPVYQKLRSDVKIALIYLLVNVVILSTVGFVRLVKIIVRPLERLVNLADSCTDEDMLFLGPESGDEFTQLSRSLNRMLRRIGADNEKLRASVQSLAVANEELRRNRQEMVRAEKLAAIGRLSAGLAHEVGNPLGIIHGYLEILGHEGLSHEEKSQYLTRAGQELDRINILIRQLLDFSRISPQDVGLFSVNQILCDTIDLVRLKNKRSSIQFIKDLRTENDCIETNEDSLRQVILNCLLNAADSIEEKGDVKKGVITVSTTNRISEQGDADEIIITISDNGAGIPEETIDKIFDPFFTTKEVGQGTGLGLYVSHTIIENFDGRMRAESVEGRGTDLIIELPVRKMKVS